MVFVGTNNLDCSATNIFDGICEIVKVIKSKLNDPIILLPVSSSINLITYYYIFLSLQTLLPRGQYPNINRDRNMAVNKLLMECFNCSCNSKNDLNQNVFANVHVVPIHGDIIQSDETISHHIMHDYLHLTNQGYYKIFGPVYEKLHLLLTNNDNA